MSEEGKKILIIEEDIDVLTLIYTTLLPMDFVIEATLDLSEMKLRMERFRPNLLLIGSTLARAQQLDVLAWAHQQFDMQIIVMGEMEAIAVPLYNHLFIADFLIKPIEAYQLLIKINNLMPA